MKEKLLLLHGALGSNVQFAELKEKLSSGFDVFDFNFTGHGGLPIQESFSIDLFVQDTMNFLERLGLHAVHIFGYSMGGYVALKLAHDFPGKANKIITLGTKFRWNPESAAREVRMMNPDVIEQKIPAFAATLLARHQPEDWKRIMRLTGEMMTALGDGVAMTPEEFNSIDHDVLVCIGTDDHMVTREETAETASYLKHGTLKIIEGFKHPLEAVDKDLLAEICVEFLRKPTYENK